MSFYNTCKRILQCTIIKLCRVELINPEKEPESGALVCGNHISNFDPVLICATLKHQICFMAKKELFGIPILGTMLKSFGSFPVNRGSVDLNAMKTAINLLDTNKFVGMFPQGTRYTGVHPRTSKPKGGVGMIITRAENDVLPVAIITKGNRFKFGRKIYIVLGDVIKFSDFNCSDKSRDEFERLSTVVFDAICDLYDKYSYLVEEK